MKLLRMLSPAGFLVLALLAACLNACAASGRDSKGRLSSWDNLKSLTRGQEIRVVMNNAKSYQGNFESFSDDGITLQQESGEQTLARKDVLRVSWKGKGHWAKNALIGAAAGAGLGLVAGLVADHIIWSHYTCTNAELCRNNGPPNPHWALIGTPVVAGPGAVIGAAIPTAGWHDIYRGSGWRHLIYRAN